jgi:hypothetical protein
VARTVPGPAIGALGLLVGFAVTLAGTALVRPAAAPCEPASSTVSVARAWNEVALDAVRHDLPAPTVHARNLYHLSVAMWDAWSAYDPEAGWVLADETVPTDGLGDAEVAAARETAISYAAYRILEHRYLRSVGASDSLPAFRQLMAAGCRPVSATETEGSSPTAVGNRVAATVLAATADDGANEADRYAATGYEPRNEPLDLGDPRPRASDPARWQPLRIPGMVTQNGIPVEDAVQTFVGPHWGGVAAFALPAGGADRLPIDPGGPPSPDEPAFRAGILEVLRLSAMLDPADGVVVDISPGAQGDSRLGTNDGTGHATNPVTGAPYAPNVVRRADFARILAEYWADGPRSETPPGHWNVLANEVSDALDPELRVGGTGPVVARLEWDVKLYLALNGATHDAAVAAWGAKGFYDSARPVTLIRTLGALGQSSDPTGPAYHPDGLPLEPGLVEVVTRRTTRDGGRHAALRGHEGELAVRAWAGRPADPERETGGVAWVRAVKWLPYQLPTFVTPAFAGYVSGHSTFSRAAAEVLTAMTGSRFFPGGLGSWVEEADSLEFEAGPPEDVVLQWATYQDAADQAGISRLYGGIHVPVDDLHGRLVGFECGVAAWARAEQLFGAAA